MTKKLEAWVVSISMGLGHQRATYPLKEIAHDGIKLIGEKDTSSEDEIKLWNQLRGAYEFISRVKKVPLIGNLLFGALDTIQNIPPLYPLRDLSEPSFNNMMLEKYIKRGMGKSFMEMVLKTPLPFVSSYPFPALIADHYNHTRNYCIICDAQINRVWAATEPKKSHIQYFAPCGRAVQRLKLYGVPDDRIFLTGFPMPKSLTGDKDLDVLKSDVFERLHYLDPKDRFWSLHKTSTEYFLEQGSRKFKPTRVLGITYAVGGAGALADVGVTLAKSFKKQIKNKELQLNLVCGIREEVRDYFVEELQKLDIDPKKDVKLIYSPDIYEYFEQFNAAMRVTDVLWTKPSELSFYAGLGIPIVMTQPVGSQEVYNRQWLIEVQAGIDQKDPEYADQWFYDLLNEGRLAEAAWDGFLKARKYGTYKIEEILLTGTMKREKSPLFR